MNPAVVILAGQRAGARDPLAVAAGVSHKALAPVAGVPMLVRTLRTVAAALPDAPLLLSIEDAHVLDGLPDVAALRAAGRLRTVEARANLVDSVLACADAAGTPLILTTADNVLVTPAALRRLAAFLRASPADAVMCMARREAVLAAHPEGQRKFYRFRDGEFSNCNLYAFRTDRALRVAEAFREGGQFVKHPARIARAFGLANLLHFRMGTRTLLRTCQAVGRRFGVDLQPLVMADGRLSIDVDNERTLRVTEEILAREGEAVPA